MTSYAVLFNSGETVPTRLKHNFVASNTPNSGHGTSFGYDEGSVWIYTSNIWVCTDPTTGSAVWTAIDGSGGGGGFANPMTTAGDLIKATSGGTATRHAIGTDRQYLATSNTSIAWRDDAPLATDLSVSGSHDIDYGLAATHDLTLTGNATFTLSGAVTGQSTDLRIVLRQDGTGSRTVTWPGSITWAGGSAPTLQAAADAVDTIGLLSVDDGTTWLGYYDQTGTSLTAASTVEAETTFGISAAVGTDTEYARQDHTHGTPTNPVTAAAVKAVGRWEPVQFDDGSSPWPFVYHDDEIVVAFIETP